MNCMHWYRIIVYSCMTCGFDRPHTIRRDVSHMTKYPRLSPFLSIFVRAWESLGMRLLSYCAPHFFLCTWNIRIQVHALNNLSHECGSAGMVVKVKVRAGHSTCCCCCLAYVHVDQPPGQANDLPQLYSQLLSGSDNAPWYTISIESKH